MSAPVFAVIAQLEDVIYPRRHYADRACRAGAEILNKLLGIDVLEALTAYYVPGAEDLAVRAALEEKYRSIDARIIAKTAAIMAAHAARLSPYADAVEVFSLLQALEVPLGLIVDGPSRSQRQLARSLGVEKIFPHIIYTGELTGEQPWNDALGLMELLLDCPLSDTALVCARASHARLAAGTMGRIYRVFRNAPGGHRQSASVRFSHVIPMINLYDLPEALGFVAWPE